MEVQDLINQQARKHSQTKKVAEDTVEYIRNNGGDANVDEIYNILHKRGIISISNGVTIESFNMKKTFWYWVVFVLLAIWQLPQFLVAVVMLPFLGKKKLVADRHYNFCWQGEGMSGGISLGPFSYVSKYFGTKPPYIAHEVDGHTVDSKIFGPLYLLVIGIPSILNAAFDFTEHYYDFYPERWANKHAKLKVVRKGVLDVLEFDEAES